MKQLLLFFLFILLSVSAYSQVQGPPPPCGIGYVLEACDADEDGITQFKLSDAYGYLFCNLTESAYEVPKFYTDAAHTNQITNYEAYTNTSNPQTIYATTVNISSQETLVLKEFDIEAKLLVYSVTRLTLCDSDDDSFESFNLADAVSFCGTSKPTDYAISYYISQENANNRSNRITNPESYNSSTTTIYTVIENIDTGAFEHNSFDIKVMPPPPIIEFNEYDFCSISGKYQFDLSLFDIDFGSLDEVVVSYYLSQSDADNNVNALSSSYTNTESVETLYARAESALGCYSITSFVLIVNTSPVITEPSDFEVCDDETLDGFALFDLESKTAEILGDLVNVNISYHESQADAETGLNSLSALYNNTLVPQTIYVRVSDITFGCYSVASFNLIVKDCSDSGVLEINAFYDANTDSIFDSDENFFENGFFTYEANNDGIQHVISSSTGAFSIISDDDNNTYDISYTMYDEYLGCYHIVTPTFTDASATNGNVVNYNFPITKVQDCGDIAVYLVSYVPPRPGFEYVNYLIIKNKGLETVTSGVIQFTHDASITLDNVANIDAGNSVTNTATGFTLDFVDLHPNQQEVVTVSMNVPVSTSLGILLTNSATYSVSDLSIENNTSTLSEIVVVSYDPNDIAESHGPQIFYDEFESDDYLYYTIRFQNVGTADAINVSIENTLDTGLDKSSIVMLSSSHDNVFTRVDNQLTWQFDNIHLPSEDMDEPNSHGYVYYKIKPTSGYKVADVIPNTAEIYFDFNPAVITNTFETEFVAVLSNLDSANAEFMLYPSPAKDEVTLNFNKNINHSIDVNVYDIQGKLLINAHQELIDKQTTLNLSRLSQGLYFVKASHGGVEITQKLIVK